MKILVDKNQTAATVRSTSPLRRELMKLFPSLRPGDSIGMTQLESIAQARARGIVTPRKIAARVQNAWFEYARRTGSIYRMLVRSDGDGGYRVHLVDASDELKAALNQPDLPI